MAFLIPGLRNLLELTSISLSDGAIVAAGALVPFLGNETAKLLTFKGTADSRGHYRPEVPSRSREAAPIERVSDLRKSEISRLKTKSISTARFRG
jgi:hypothetical protein